MRMMTTSDSTKESETTIGEDRLRRAAVHLRKVDQRPPDVKWDMSCWATMRDFDRPLVLDPGLSCLTAACAIGHCAEVFEADGLEWHSDGLFLPGLVPVFNKYRGMDAVAAFFQIPTVVATFFFHGGAYPRRKATPAMVAERIEKYLRNYNTALLTEWLRNGQHQGV